MNIGLKKTDLRPIGEVEVPASFYNRYLTGIEGIDLLFGGEEAPGIVPGTVITVAGKGGTGKSTGLMQMLDCYIGYSNLDCAYVAIEESREQVSFKCKRWGIKSVPVQQLLELSDIISLIKDHALKVLVIDSFPAVKNRFSTSKGARYQQEITDAICTVAKETGCAVFMVMHMTKAGKIKGDTGITHTVDVNLVMRNGEKEYGDKTIVIWDIAEKNRFGPFAEFVTKMTRNGHIFENIEEMVAAERVEQKVNKRTAKKQEELDTIMAMSEPPGITPERVMKALDCDWSHAFGRMMTLVKNGKMKMYGQGRKAIFKKLDLELAVSDSDSEEEDEE